MKQKINLTLDVEHITRTKRFARKKGIFISPIIESLLVETVLKDEKRFSQKWQGKFKLTQKRQLSDAETKRTPSIISVKR